MEAVAEHINEMQKIFEEYGSVFDELSKMFREIHPQKKVNILLMRIEDYCNETDRFIQDSGLYWILFRQVYTGFWFILDSV
jgi:hypothetical protein